MLQGSQISISCGLIGPTDTMAGVTYKETEAEVSEILIAEAIAPSEQLFRVFLSVPQTMLTMLPKWGKHPIELHVTLKKWRFPNIANLNHSLNKFANIYRT